tara:strand:- start:1489 stop:2655 length:1167 start_codon:yes stop_codon:yes gene_type:complete
MSKSKNVQVCWVTGGLIKRQSVIEKIKKQIGVYDLFVFGAEDTYKTVDHAIRTLSMFDDRKKLVIVNDFPVFKSTRPTAIKNLVKTLYNVPPNCIVILNNISTKVENFVKCIKEVGKIYNFPQNIELAEAYSVVISEMSNKDKVIKQEDVELLVSSIAPRYGRNRTVDIDRLFMLMYKLLSYVGDRKVIKHDDVLSIYSDHAELITWELFDLLDAKEYAKSISMLQKHLSKAIRPEEEMAGLLHALIWRYRQLVFIKEGASKKWTEKQIVKEIQKIPKLKRVSVADGGGPGISMRLKAELNKKGSATPLYSEKGVEYNIRGWGSRPTLACYSRKELLTILKVLEESLLKIRSTDSEIEKIMCFDAIFMTICNVVNPENTKFLRDEYRY